VLTELANQKEVALGSLIATISNGEGVSRSAVARVLYRLSEEGEIRLEITGPRSLWAGFFSVRNLKFWALFSIPLITALTILGSSINPIISYLRFILGSVVVLFLPGYGVIDVLYSEKELGMLQVIIFSAALSLAIIPLVGLVLNYSPWGISLDSVFASFLLVDAFLFFAASIHRFGSPRT
jgi:uncharacterized membrane protein